MKGTTFQKDPSGHVATVSVRTGWRFFVLLLCLLLFGCATVSDRVRMEKFERTSKAYEKALRRAFFETALGFMGQETLAAETDVSGYKNIKVFDYEVKDIRLSQDNRQVHQTAEIKYFALDSYILRTIQDEQSWQYDEKNGNWILQTGLPDFK